MKNKIVKEILEGILFRAMLASVLAGMIKASAASADTDLPEEYVRYCEEAGKAYGICPELIMAVIEKESDGNPDAVGQAGEIGLMQVYPKFHMGRAQDLGVYNLFDPEGNILVGTDYLAELFAEHQDAGTALMIYNGVDNAAERGKKGNYTKYAEEILERAREIEIQHGK